jgi:tetratricopeptide (TPR) repeat protein
MLRWLAPLVAVAAVTVSARGQVREPLGKIIFPNSGSPAAQADFIRGVAWLHSFGYEEAIDAFRAAQKIDRGFALAYWGEAMAFNQPLWFHEDTARGRAALMKLAPTPSGRAAKAPTPREQMYLAATEALYGTGSKAARDQAYLTAMATLAAKFPEDDEARAFHALAILATLPRGDASLPLRRTAGALVEAVFARNPQHPGAAHYVLHAYDHPALAARGLPAARAYAKIAPAASHALHMPAHAFVQLGLWDEAAASDQASWDASIAWATRKGLTIAMRDYHSLGWLQYEWTQQGRFSKAREALQIVDRALEVVGSTGLTGGHHDRDSEIGRGSGPDALRNDRGSMRARYIVESERWHEMTGATTFDNVDELFALGISAVKLRNLDLAGSVIRDLQKLTSAGESDLRQQALVMFDALGGLIMMARGQPQEAFKALEIANASQAKMPKPIGRPYPIKGADELYGEVLLQAGRPKEALVWFERALARTPNRSRAVLGLARAAQKAGDAVKSRRAYAQFLVNWRLADPGLPEIKEAQAGVVR